MKNIFLLLTVLLTPSLSHARGLPVDLSSYSNYKLYNIKGLTLVLHESLYRDKAKAQEALTYWSRAFSRVEKTCPNTTSHFKKSKYKLYLYLLPSSRGGMEFIRDNQHRWDKRLNAYVNEGIIIPRAHVYSTYGQREAGFVYLLHEIAHYRHVVMIKENGRGYDRMIRVEYNKAMRNPLYRGTYASKNYLEYFAETSMAYLLKRHTISAFPSGSKQLYDKDRIGYNLCREIWGRNLAAYKPQEPQLATNDAPAKPPVQSMSPFGMAPEPTIDIPTTTVYGAPTAVNAGAMLFQERSMAHATSVFRMPSKGTVIISRQFLEIKSTMSRAETEEFSGNYAMSNWLYSNSMSMLIAFKKENPYWNASVIDGMISRVKPKIN